MARMRVGGEIAASVKKTSASTVAKKHRTRKTSHHGRDPWSRAHLGGQQDDVQVTSQPASTCLPQEAMPIKVESDVQQDTAKASTEDDEVALPTPIYAPCKIIAADGRVETIDRPIAGFEHLFQASNQIQGTPCSEIPAPTGRVTSRTRQRPLPCTTSNSVVPCTKPSSPIGANTTLRSRDTFSRHEDSSTTREENFTSVLHSESLLWTKNHPEKRCRGKVPNKSRSIAVVSACPSDNDEESESEQCPVTTVIPRSFRMGDFKELKTFLCNRMDELTMKPFRPIVTMWIKLLEPKRLRDYGSYHKRMPFEKPEDTTPPWWPRDCHYNEPSHLSKSDLVILATDIILLHRPKDENKRRLAWVTRLREAADCALGLTPPEQFSSSDDPIFGKLMRDRARDLILPSLFNVAQSYEDYVHQYRLWEEEEDAHVPRGKTIVWIKYDRPPRQCVSRKRKAKVSTAITPPLQNDAADEQSGDETEVDETMANNAIKRAHRYQEILLKKRAKLSFKAQEDTPATPPQSVAYADATPKIASSIDAPSALAASRHGPSVLAASVETSSGTTEVQTGRSMRTSPCTSFDHSMHQLELSEDAKPRGLHQSAVSQMQFSNDVKPHHHLQPSYTPSNSLYQYPGGYPTIHVDWPHPSLEATQHASVIQTPASSSVVSPYLQNHVPYMYNNIYQSFGDGLPLDNDFSYGYQLPSQGAAASMPPQALLPFTGLPIEYTPSQAGTSQPVCQTPGMAHPVPMSHA